MHVCSDAPPPHEYDSQLAITPVGWIPAPVAIIQTIWPRNSKKRKHVTVVDNANGSELSEILVLSESDNDRDKGSENGSDNDSDDNDSSESTFEGFIYEDFQSNPSTMD